MNKPPEPPDPLQPLWDAQEAAILLEAGSKTIAKLMDDNARLLKELGEWQTKYVNSCEQVVLAAAGNAKVIRALDASCQLIEALLAWLPEGIPVSPDVGSAKGAWSEAMKAIRR